MAMTQCPLRFLAVSESMISLSCNPQFVLSAEIQRSNSGHEEQNAGSSEVDKVSSHISRSAIGPVCPRSNNGPDVALAYSVATHNGSHAGSGRVTDDPSQQDRRAGESRRGCEKQGKVSHGRGGNKREKKEPNYGQ